jgi:CBS domain-containing protein
MRVHHAMTADVATVAPEAPLRDVARLLGLKQISGVPVVKDAGGVVGVVSEADLLRAAEKPRRPRRLPFHRNGLRPGTAGAEMSSPPVTIAPDRAVAEAAALMLDRGVNRLPVVDGGRLVGIVTRADLVRAFARGDESIAREIRSDVVLRGIYVKPSDVRVGVQDGEVELEGEVESRGKAERLVELAREVPGVVCVRSRVTWRVDENAPRGVRARR